jgi:hypothetical protein
MTRDFGWASSARRYLAIYRELAPAAPLVSAEQEQEPVAEHLSDVEAARATAA